MVNLYGTNIDEYLFKIESHIGYPSEFLRETYPSIRYLVDDDDDFQKIVFNIDISNNSGEYITLEKVENEFTKVILHRCKSGCFFNVTQNKST